MKAAFRVAGLVLAGLLITAVVVGLWKREELTRLWAVNTLFEEDRIVENFSNMNRLFPTTPVPRGDFPPTPLVRGPTMDLPESVSGWIDERNVTALVVLHDGEIVFEDYYQGTDAADRRISWSVAKSYLSTLFGVLLDEGVIESLDDPVTKYAPALEGGAYDGATIRDVLNMASGVAFDEDITDFNSDLSRMGRVLALGRSMDDFAADLSERAGEPGENWRYVSVDTHILGMVIRGATGRSIPELMSEKIVAPLGLEAEPYYVTDGYGIAFVLGGLNMTTRDYARFGQMLLDGGEWAGRRIVPEWWVEESTRAGGPGPASDLEYGYQWWVPPNAAPGEFMAEGIYGQYVYVNRPANVVIAANSADREFQGKTESNVEVFRRIVAAINGNGRITSNRSRRAVRRRPRPSRTPSRKAA